MKFNVVIMQSCSKCFLNFWKISYSLYPENKNKIDEFIHY